MKKLFYLISLTLFVFSCSETESENLLNSSCDLKSLEIKNLNGFDFKLNTKNYLSYTGKVSLKSNYINAHISIDQEYKDAIEYSTIGEYEKKLLRSYNSIAEKELFYHNISSTDGTLQAEVSEFMDSEKFTIQIDNCEIPAVHFDEILEYYTGEIHTRACVPCIMAGIAVVGAVACGIANVIDSDNCTSAFQSACGDGGQCCSMEYEGGTCGNGDCNISC